MASEYDWHPAPAQGSVFKVETRNVGWWVLLAIFVSVIIHMLLYLALGAIRQQKKLEEYTEKIIPLRGDKQLSIDPKKLNELLADSTIPEDRPDIKPEKLSDMDTIDKSLDEFDLMEKIKEEAIRLAPIEAPQIFSGEAPKVPSQALDVASRDLQISAGDMFSKDINDMRNKLVDSSAIVSADQPILELSQSDDVGKGVDTDEFFKNAVSKAFGTEADEFVKGYSTLDGLLGHTGGLPSGEEKIALPTDILFEFNEYKLKEQARLSMMKLAFLVQTNPDALFVIEGHTDSIGGVEFNRDLSLKRASAVRDWLQQKLRIEAKNIQVVGIGKDRPLIPIAGIEDDRDAQALNRRVEIVVKSP